MMRSRRPLVAGLILAAGLAFGGQAAPVAAQTGSLFPAGVLVVPVAGVVGVAVPPVVMVPPIGVGTQRTHIERHRSHSERADVTIGGD